MITIPVLALLLGLLALVGYTYLPDPLPSRHDVLRWVAGRSRVQVDGPPPGDPGHEHYMTELEHATIRPLGANPWHCADCMGYVTAHRPFTREAAA